MGLFLTALDQLIVATALPQIAGELGDLTKGPWIFTAYLLTSTCALLLWGRLGDLYGRRPVFQAAIVVFVVASVIAGLSQSMTQLVIGRGLQGIAAGALASLPHAILADLVPARRRAPYLAFFTGTWAAVAFVGPVLGGVLVDGPGWRWIFYVNIPTGLVAFALISAMRVGVERVEHRLDFGGAALLVVGVGALIFGTSRFGAEPPLGGGALTALTLLTVFGLVGFVAWERRAAEPLVPLRMLANRDVAVAATANFLFGLGNFSIAVFLPMHSQIVGGTSATAGGLTLLPISLGMFVGSLLIGQRIVATGRYRLWPPACIVVYIGTLLVMTRMDADTPRALVLVYSLLLGLGSSGVGPVVVIAMQNAVPHRDLGAVSALQTFSRQTGQAVGTALLGTVMATRLTTYLLEGTDAAQRGALSIAELRDSPQAIGALAEPLRGAVVESFRLAIGDVFWGMVVTMALSLVAFLGVRNRVLRESVGDAA